MTLADYKGKLALITGAGDGIGEMLAKGFAAEGLRVCVQDIRAESAERVVGEIGAAAFPLVADVSDRADLQRAANELAARGETLSILWINAGVGVGGGLLKSKPEAVEWGFAVNALGVIWTAQIFRPLMKDGPLHVGITASTASLRSPSAPNSLYATTKHATLGIAEALASEFAAEGIGTTILCPGLLNTDIWDGARARPERFGGPRRQDPSIAVYWRQAQTPDVMWPHIRERVANGGGYLVCATDQGETRAVFTARADAIRAGIVEVGAP
jgi:NAD(P)-dependent dehydrogenase (short-subunit alcohol dehydrogenase family)